MTTSITCIIKHPAHQYALDVVEGRELAGRLVRLACQRYLDDLVRGPDRGIWFDPAAGERVIEFFENFLILYEGQFDGQPFLLRPWQKFILWNLFGWKNADGYRRFRTAYIEIAKGNGKTPLAAGIGLYGLIADDEPGAEIYSAATQKEQAGILFRDAEQFAMRSPSLRRRLKIGIFNIAYHEKASFLRPISSEKRGLDGKRPHMALIDEIHEHPDATVVDKMTAGIKGHRQPMIIEITNSGFDRHTVCFAHHDYSERILCGVFDNDTWFSYITGLDSCPECLGKGHIGPRDGCELCDDFTDPRTWRKANPNLGVSVTEEYLRKQVDEAVAMPSKRNIVLRLNFCVWTQASTRWISPEKWAQCGRVRFTEAELAGRTCYGGLDLASVNDIVAYVLDFPPLPDEDPAVHRWLARFFVPQERVQERVDKDRLPYDVWVRQGFITAIPGSQIDDAFVIAQIEKDMRAFNLLEMAFDRWGSRQVVTALQALGFDNENDRAQRRLVDFGQGYASMSSPCKDLEKMIGTHTIAHGGNPVLAWMAGNCIITQDPAGNIKLDKSKSREKIDGMVAGVMALDRALRNGTKTSVYETRGVRAV